MTASLGEELQRTPGLTLKPATANNTLLGLLRRPVGPEVAVARPPRAARRQPRASTGRRSTRPRRSASRRLTNSIIPSHFEFFWQPPAIAVRRGPGQAAPRGGRLPQRLRRRRLHRATRVHAGIAEAGRQQPARRRHPRASSARSSGRRYYKGHGREEAPEPRAERRARAFGNAPTRIEAFVAGGGAYVYGSYPDIDGLFREQGAELDRKRREAALAPHPAARPREGDVRAHLAARGDGRLRAAGARNRGSGSSPGFPSPARTRT